MTHVPRLILAACLLLALPSAYFAWRYRAMPNIGSYHDDAVYLISARSMAGGNGYRIQHLVENPAQTKYPPLYPGLLSLVWRFGGAFPDNLKVAMAMQFAFLPAFLLLTFLYLRRTGLHDLLALGLTAIVAIGPMTILFAVSTMSELPFSILLLGVMLLLDKDCEISPRRVFLAGLLAAAAFLVRTNAIVLIASVPFLMLRSGRKRAAALFAAPLAVSIALWQIWIARNGFHATDDVLSYYTSYAGFYARTFTWSGFPERFWINAGSVIESAARLVFFNSGDELWIRPIAWVMTVVSISGIVVLYRRGFKQYSLFALLFVGVLLIWQFPPDSRFLFPLLPLYVAGLAAKLSDVWKLGMQTLRQGTMGNRIASILVATLIVLLAAASTVSEARALTGLLPAYFYDRQVEREKIMPAYRWIKANTEPTARFSAYDDTLLYLYTGRQGYTQAILPRLVYPHNPDAIPDYIRTLPEFWRAKRVDYVMVTLYDFRRDFHDPALDALRAMTADASRFQQVYNDPSVQVYRFQPTKEIR